MVNYWLLKNDTDPHQKQGVEISYTWEQLCADGRARFWGVRNFRARNYLRDGVAEGDLAFFYASSCKNPGIKGVCRIVRAGYPDVDAATPGHPYHDPKHTSEQPRWYCIDLQPAYPLAAFLSNKDMAADSVLQASNMVALRIPRLSVQPVTAEQWERIHHITGTPLQHSSSSGGSSSSGAAASTAAVGSAGQGGGAGQKRKRAPVVAQSAAAEAAEAEEGSEKKEEEEEAKEVTQPVQQKGKSKGKQAASASGAKTSSSEAVEEQGSRRPAKKAKRG